MAMTPEAPFYQIAKVAHILRISRPLALRLVREGDLPSVRTPQGLRVASQSLAEWVEGQIASCQESHGLAKGSKNQ
jgi:predicted site-specific integrase-resolvase